MPSRMPYDFFNESDLMVSCDANGTPIRLIAPFDYPSNYGKTYRNIISKHNKFWSECNRSQFYAHPDYQDMQDYRDGRRVTEFRLLKLLFTRQSQTKSCCSKQAISSPTTISANTTDDASMLQVSMLRVYSGTISLVSCLITYCVLLLLSTALLSPLQRY